MGLFLRKCWIATFFLAIFTLIILEGCDGPDYSKAINTSGKRATAELITAIMDCDIYSIRVEGTGTIYLTKCKDGSASTMQPGKHPVYQVQSGNSPTIPPAKIPYVNNPNSNAQHAIENGSSPNIGDAATSLDDAFKSETTNEQQILDLADKIKKRREAIDRLSSEDRALLGLDSKK